MPALVYRDKAWLYEHYVTKRMKLTQIQKMLKEKHGITISTQALYNHCKRHDLLKYRGKGRTLKMKNPTGKSMGMSPKQKQLNAIRQRNKAMKRTRPR